LGVAESIFLPEEKKGSTLVTLPLGTKIIGNSKSTLISQEEAMLRLKLQKKKRALSMIFLLPLKAL